MSANSTDFVLPMRRLLAIALLPLIAATNGCDLPVEETRSTSSLPPYGDGFSTSSQAVLAAGQQVMMTDATHNFAETYTFPYFVPGSGGSPGTWELFSIAGTNIAGWDPANHSYGCTRSNQTVVDTQSIGGLTNNGGDDSGFYRSMNFTGNDWLFMVNLFADGNGIRIFHSNNPCRAGGGSPWAADSTTLATDGSVDYPHATYDDRNDVGWVAWAQNRTINGVTTRGLNIARIPLGGGTLTPFANSCSRLAAKNLNFVNIATDFFGTVHAVYDNQTDGVVEHDEFNPSTNTWKCGNTPVGSFSLPGNTCAGCAGRATLFQLQSNCLRGFAAPSIAIERPPVTDDVMIATYSTPGSGACSNASETRVYRSTNYGVTWTQVLVTGCTTSVLPRAAVAHTSGFAGDTLGNMHVVSSYVPGGDNRLRQVDWRSTDSGATWGGTFLTPVRNTNNPINAANCFWGDFNGLAADQANARFFSNWGELRAAQPRWTTEGISFNR